ncbi:MAG: AAA family ATPase [Cyclobacteriaceae bacterium]|jgi:Cdc6-like AAA superfamily ATPase
MEIEINSSVLIDSPYEKGQEKVFSIDESIVENLVNDITLGHPTCYLISGYKGVGKTSLVRRVEEQINDTKEKNEVVFVYTSFTGFSKSNNLIRKLVRELFLRVEKTQKFKDLKEDIDDPDNFKDSLTLFYAQTFYEVSETKELGQSIEKTWLFDLPVRDLVKVLVKQMSPLLLLFLFATPLVGTIGFQWIMWLLPIAAVLWAMFNILSINYTFRKDSVNRRNFLIKSLYDDEIAETIFLSLLKTAKKKGFRIVFVLDELDKADQNQIDSLISELKVFLVSGFASFILVGGQDFYYKYRYESELDDSVLSSLFSKVYHVPVSSAVILKNFFLQSVMKSDSALSEDDRLRLEEFIDYLIVKSRLIPRRFINNLKQHTKWIGQRAFLTDDEAPRSLKKYKVFIDTVDRLDDSKIASEHHGAVHDFIIMQLYISLNKR